MCLMQENNGKILLIKQIETIKRWKDLLVWACETLPLRADPPLKDCLQVAGGCHPTIQDTITNIQQLSISDSFPLEAEIETSEWKQRQQARGSKTTERIETSETMVAERPRNRRKKT